MEYVLPAFLGAVLWTFMEYNIHRFMAHEFNWPNPFRSEHLRHHFVKDYFAPAYKKALAAIVVISIMTGLTSLFLDFTTAFVFSGSFTAMYLFYEYTHWSFHVFGPLTPYGKYMRKHHFYHHFVDDQMNHGVTTPVWDILYRTFKRSDQVKVNEKYTMRWLVKGPEDKIPLPQFSRDYKIVPRTRVT